MSMMGKSGMLRAVFGALVIAALLATSVSTFSRTASGATTTVAGFEAETMSLSGTGSGKVVSDGAASGGKALFVWSNATASKTKSIPSRANMVVVRVKADQCQGSPQMTVKVNGKQVIQEWVWQTSYASYAAGVDLASGSHRVEITMSHDYRTSSTCDRNLRVDKVSFVASTTTTPPADGATDLFEGAKLYVDPYSNAKRQADEWRASRPEDASQMDKIAGQADADWFGDWSGDVEQAVNERVTTVTNAGALPVLVAYNIPVRDCSGYSGGGATSPEAYKTWIRSFADGIGSRKAAIILEPDAVALTSCLSEADKQTRLALIKDAVSVLKAKGNTAVYVDAGHSGWVGASEMASRLTEAGISGADGFSLNVSNFQKTSDNVAYGKDVSSRTGGKHFVVDTARNGLGPSPDSQWCNPPGRALGEKPGSSTSDPLVDAYLWIKPPGESDGSCNGGPSAGTWWPEYALGLAERAAY